MLDQGWQDDELVPRLVEALAGKHVMHMAGSSLPLGVETCESWATEGTK
jgi:hypothetical protein